MWYEAGCKTSLIVFDKIIAKILTLEDFLQL